MPKTVTCLVVNNEGKLLILKRSDKVGTYRNLWSGVAGYVEENETPYETAIKELREETGLEKKDLSLVKKLDSIKFADIYNGKHYDWEIFPFLFRAEKKKKIDIDWEHLEYRWIAPSDIKKYDTVPYFKEIVSKLLL